jgi:transcriptional regulator with XRE-family HTH domain
MASTRRVDLLRFELQMAEQAQRFGARVRELRVGHGWEQKDLVARMHELGDTAINTNQLSRYENGKGPMPRDGRQEIFASALKTTADDLRAGPPSKRKPKRSKDDGLMDALSKSSDLPDGVVAAFEALRLEMVATRTQLLAEIAKVQAAQEGQRSKRASGGRRSG